MSARNKLDCRVCGQDVFVKTVVHVHGTRRTVTAVGWCKQCGNGVRRREVFEAGKRVDAEVAVLAPRTGKSAGCSDPCCLLVLAAVGFVVVMLLLAVAGMLFWAGLLDWMGVPT